MRVLIVAIATLLVLSAMPAAAGKQHHHRHHRQHHEPDRYVSEIVVLDQASPAWSDEIAETVEDFNLLGIPYMPHLIYQRDAQIACESVRICSTPLGPYAGLAYMSIDLIKLADDHDDIDAIWPEWRNMVVCHEFMHELADVLDAYDSQPGMSCVYGQLTDPGSYDVMLLTQHWRAVHDAFAQQQRKPKHHKRGRHR